MRQLVKNKKMAYLISIFCMFLWGSAFPTVKLTYAELGIQSQNYFSMIFVAGLRFFIAGIIVLIMMLIFDKDNIKQLKTEFPYLLVLSMFVISLGYFFFYIGTGNTSGMQASIISASSTFLVVIFSHFLLHDEKFNKYKLIAIILGLTGTIISNLNKELNFNFSIVGEGFMFINSILMACGTIFIKKRGKNVSAFANSSGQLLYGSIPLILIGYFGMDTPLVFTFKSILLIFYGGIISSVAFVLWYFVLKEYKASEIAFLRLFIPFFGTFLSAVVLGEQLNYAIIIGLIFVIIGIIIVNKSNDIKVRNEN